MAEQKLTHHPDAEFHPIRKRGKGYVVIAKHSGKPLSKKPLSKGQARKQLAAVEMHMHGEG